MFLLMTIEVRGCLKLLYVLKSEIIFDIAIEDTDEKNSRIFQNRMNRAFE